MSNRPNPEQCHVLDLTHLSVGHGPKSTPTCELSCTRAVTRESSKDIPMQRTSNGHYNFLRNFQVPDSRPEWDMAPLWGQVVWCTSAPTSLSTNFLVD